MKVICISGYAGAGKDTAGKIFADELSERGYRTKITHYADLLKYVLKEFFDWDGKKDKNGRNLLQVIGNDKIRKQNPDFWVDFLITVAKALPENTDYLIIPDARYPNEIEKWKENGIPVRHVRITTTRPSSLTEEQKKHYSETALDGYPYDELIRNDGTLDELRESCKAVLELKWGVI